MSDGIEVASHGVQDLGAGYRMKDASGAGQRLGGTVQKLEDAGCTMWSGDGQNPSATSLALGSAGFSLGFLFWVANTGFPVITLMFLPGFGMRRAKGTTQVGHPAPLWAGTLPGPLWGRPLPYGHGVPAEVAIGSTAEARREKEQIQEWGTAQKPCRSHARPLGCQEPPRGRPRHAGGEDGGPPAFPLT